MAKSEATTSPTDIFDLQAIAAERRVNIVRVAAIVVFYLVHFLRVNGPRFSELFPSLNLNFGSQVPMVVHVCVSVLCFGWLMQCVLVYQHTNRDRISDWLGVYVTLGDLGWLTALLCMSTGPASPMVSGYFLIIMLTGIRFDLRLTRIATVAAGLSYLFLLGAARWPFGLLREIKLESVSRFHQIVTVVSIVLAGIIVGQIVRHAYQIGRRTVADLDLDSTKTEEAGHE